MNTVIQKQAVLKMTGGKETSKVKKKIKIKIERTL